MKIAVITGASSGMGREFVLQLDREENFDELWLIARRREVLEEIGKETRAKVRAISLDLTKKESIEEYRTLLEAEKPEISVLVNASGYGKFGKFEDMELDDLMGMIDLNDKALVAVTYVSLPYLKNGSRMWFILPDEGYTTADVLTDGQYMQMLLGQDWENEKWMKVNLSVPKFDVKCTLDLKNGLQEMAVADVFSESKANFEALTGDVPIFLTAVNQSVRVQIDEEGVKAAAYIEIPGAMSPAPPEEIIDFILDRPFLFAITTDSVPLFMGTVNTP